MQIVMRTPCTFHTHCDETAVALLHGRSSKDGPLTEDEWKKVCWVCEGVMSKIKDALMKTGRWTCPKCGFEHTCDVVNRGHVTPTLSFWYRALEATPLKEGA